MEVTVTESNFKAEVLESEIPVLVDFWASWCAPCRMLAPVVAGIAEEKAGEIKVCKVNVDEEPVLAAAYRVSAIPTVVAFRGGQVVNTSVGFTTKEALLSLF